MDLDRLIDSDKQPSNLDISDKAKIVHQRDPVVRIRQLWDALADYEADAWESALNFLLNELCELLQADNAIWMGLVRLGYDAEPSDRKSDRSGWMRLHHHVSGTMVSRDPMRGWRIGATLSFNTLPLEQHPDRLEAWKSLDDKFGETSRVLAAQAGHYRVRTLKTGLINLKQFKKTAHYDFFYRQLQIEDRLWAIAPVSEYSEACLVFDKKTPGQRFRRDDIRLASQCIHGLKWFFRRVLLSQGLAVTASHLTAHERRVIRYLLAGASEKVIAEELGITPGTAHQYCTRLYKKYNVKGRVEFMALWLASS